MKSKPKLKRLEFHVLSWSLLLLSLMTSGSLLGSYFSKFVVVPGAELSLLIGLLGFLFAHILVLVTGWKYDCSLTFTSGSLGIIWLTLGLIFFLRIIEML